MFNFSKINKMTPEERRCAKDRQTLNYCECVMLDIKNNNLDTTLHACVNQMVFTILENVSTIDGIEVDLNSYQHLRVYDPDTDFDALRKAKELMVTAKKKLYNKEVK